MTIPQTFRFTTLVLALCLISGAARAALVQLEITGTGANGTVGSGIFTVEDGDGNIYTPGYYAPGGIYYDGSVTLTNIPGGGPSSVTFSLLDINATILMVDSNSVQYLGPYGGHGFGPPEENYYDLTPSQPFSPSFVFQTTLAYNGSQKDLITWSPATVVSAPEPGSAVLMGAGLVVGAGVFRGRRRAPRTA
ncbi:MAG: PEP-CTERM sorting domain-containing protein [Chthoniobacter sp.]|uniref:PEP-CTERM sorting domain-containing protein n=1 Tax=Chthoniobacter sp. TaxID=2510640 RepID=UPI0032A6D85F